LASEVTNLTGYQTKALNQFAHRNLVINGDMQIAQRSSSVAGITNSSVYSTADRWKFPTDNGTWTQSVENDAPTGSGFRKSLKVLCTSSASPSAAQLTYVSQTFEGQNLQHVKKGTASAEQLTLSFWVKANVTGTYVIWVYDVDNDRQICSSYTVSASATWEYKTITFAADTTGAFDNDNAGSLVVGWHLSAGSNYTTGTLPSSWQSYNGVNRAVGQVNVAAANSNYWQVTGIQLEVGNTATPFEFKSVEDELLECQRYYQVIVSGNNKTIGHGFYLSATEVDVPITFIAEMRTEPTGSVVTGTDYYSADNGTSGDGFNTMTLQKASTSRCNFYSGTGTSGTAFRPCLVVSANAASFIAVQAEL
jgi:hypothetical protein